MLHDFAYILRVLARGDEQSVVRIDNNKILYSNDRNELFGGINKVPVGREREALVGADDILSLPIRRMLVERRPGAEVVPSEICGDAVQIRLTLTLGGTRFKKRV